MAWWTIIGLGVGALLDLLIRWMAAARSDIAPSLCSSCQSPRVDRRLIPLLGPFLVSRCKLCGRPQWPSPVAIQLAAAVAFASAAWRASQVGGLLVLSLYAAVLVLVFVFDLRHRLVLNVVTYPAMLAAILFSALLSPDDPLRAIERSLLGGLFAGGLFLALFLLAALLYGPVGALGLGDVKLALLIGLMTGWPFAVAALVIGSIIGAVIGVALMMRMRSRRAMMPYGTALSLGAMATILWHPPG